MARRAVIHSWDDGCVHVWDGCEMTSHACDIPFLAGALRAHGFDIQDWSTDHFVNLIAECINLRVTILWSTEWVAQSFLTHREELFDWIERRLLTKHMDYCSVLECCEFVKGSSLFCPVHAETVLTGIAWGGYTSHYNVSVRHADDTESEYSCKLVHLADAMRASGLDVSKWDDFDFVDVVQKCIQFKVGVVWTDGLTPDRLGSNIETLAAWIRDQSLVNEEEYYL